MLWYSESEFKKSICTFQSIGFIHDPLELKLHLFITLAISFKSPYLLCILRGENNSPPEKRNWQKHAWKHGGGWAKNCKRILSSFGEIQATFQWSSRHAPVWSQTMASIFWSHIWHLYKIVEVPAATQTNIRQVHIFCAHKTFLIKLFS